MFTTWNDQEAIEGLPGVVRRMIVGERVMMVRVEARAGSLVPNFRHDPEQILVVERGRILVTLEGASRELEAGDAVVIPSNALHSTRALSDAIFLEAFSPLRLDLLRSK